MVDDSPWLYYKLTNELQGSGELNITHAICIIILRGLGMQNIRMTSFLHLETLNEQIINLYLDFDMS